MTTGLIVSKESEEASGKPDPGWPRAAVFVSASRFDIQPFRRGKRHGKASFMPRN